MQMDQTEQFNSTVFQNDTDSIVGTIHLIDAVLLTEF